MGDVLIFLNRGIQDFFVFYDSMQFFSTATGMESNRLKSRISFSYFTQQEIEITLHKFPFQCPFLEHGLKYLGFHIKPHSYKISNWTWLVAKVEKRLHNWNRRFLSKYGCLVLIKSFLEAIPVY